MISSSKRIQTLQNLIEKSIYSFDEGINLIKKLGTVKFLESIELHLALNVNPKDIKQQVKGSILLPNSIKEKKKIAVFTDDINTDNLIALGAFKVGFEDLLLDINLGNINFDILITSQKNISKLSSVGRILGIRGLMPSLKNGTISNNFEKTINEFKEGKINYKTDKYGIIHLVFGKINFSIEELKENLFAIIENVKKNKPLGLKGKFFKTLYICTSMSPSIKLSNN